jgi:hypothetical protein
MTMIPNQGLWLAVRLCALLGAWGCAEGSQQTPNPNPITGASGAGAGGIAGGTAVAGAPSPRAGAGGAIAAGTAGRANVGGASAGAGAGGNGGGGGGGGAGMDAGIVNPRPNDAGMSSDSDAGLDDPTAEEWVGTTAQGLDMNFTIVEAGLRELRLQYAFPAICNIDNTGDNTARFDPPEPLDDPFSVSFVLTEATNTTFSGSFSSDGTTASGMLVFESPGMPGPAVCRMGTLTWNATRQ